MLGNAQEMPIINDLVVPEAIISTDVEMEEGN